MSKVIYVLMLESNKYYVGSTKDIVKRFKDHMSNKYSGAFVSRYKPIGIIKLENCTSIHHEDNLTKELMMEHGIENVRGGSYSQIELDNSTILFLTREFNHLKNLCLICGDDGHMAKNCKEKKKEIKSDNSDYELLKSQKLYRTFDHIDQNVKIDLCEKCNTNPPNKVGHSLCYACWKSSKTSDRKNQKVANSIMCKKCDVNPPNKVGHSLCYNCWKESH